MARNGIITSNGVDHISQRRANGHIVPSCTNPTGDIKIVATKQDVLVVDVKGWIRGIGEEDVSKAIAIHIDVAIERITGKGETSLINLIGTKGWS